MENSIHQQQLEDTREDLQGADAIRRTLRRVGHSCEPLVEYLVFAGEVKLTGPVEGSSTFASEFAARGPRDGQNRSLRDFDLKSRLFRYPCSYLIYSEAFDQLPPAAKRAVYARLWDVLSGKVPAARGQRAIPAARRYFRRCSRFKIVCPRH